MRRGEAGGGQAGEGVRAGRFFGLPGEPGGAGGVGFDDLGEVAVFGVFAALEEGVAGAGV